MEMSDNRKIECEPSKTDGKGCIDVKLSGSLRSVGIQGSPTHNKGRRDFKRSQHHFTPRDSRRKVCGVRHVRRVENLNYLLNQAEQDEDTSGEVDFVELITHKNSAFAELFLEDEKMSIWNAFVNSSEEEQQQVLDDFDKGVKLHDVFTSFENADGDVDFVDGAEMLLENLSAGNSRLTFTAQHCFQRINHNLRSFLRKNQFPKGELQKLEEELVSFFLEWPSSVYLTRLPDGFRRMLLHAVSQYLDLDSQSFDDTQGQRHTQVENKGVRFVPPTVPLAQFLCDNKTVALVAQA